MPVHQSSFLGSGVHALCAVASLWLASAPVAAQTVDSSLYIRTDSDQTTVIAPRAHARTPVASDTHVDFTYAADVWTSASIDIRASASKMITEQRDEIDVGLDHEWADITVSSGYRFSTEPDYTSHGGNLGFSYDFANNNATLAFGVSASFDRVGRAGDRLFGKSVRNFSGRIALTQVLDTETLVQGIYELMDAQGYNSSPYRYVGIGSPDGLCWNPMPTAPGSNCTPEASPDQRLKHAIALRIRRSLGARWSTGLGYRFYLDSWQVMSHTALADLAFTPIERLLLSLRYRFYTQNAASFYRPYYPANDPTQRFYTTDKELSTLNVHRLALDVERDFMISEKGQLLRPTLSIAGSLYHYSNFIPLSAIRAFEVTLGVTFEL